MSEAAEITIKGLSDLAVGTYLLVDVRDAISFGYGAIPGAVSMPDIVEQAEAGKLAKDKKYILYCMKGINSARLVPQLRELDYDAVSLSGGYSAWLMASRRRLRRVSVKAVFTKHCSASLPRQSIPMI